MKDGKRLSGVSLSLLLTSPFLCVPLRPLRLRIRPWALGRRNWLFIGSQLAGQRAAVVMSLLQSAKLNGHEPWAYLKDVLTRLPMQLNSRIEELLPHRWRPAD